MPTGTVAFTFWIMMWILIIIILSGIYIDDAYGPVSQETFQNHTKFRTKNPR